MIKISFTGLVHNMARHIQFLWLVFAASKSYLKRSEMIYPKLSNKSQFWVKCMLCKREDDKSMVRYVCFATKDLLVLKLLYKDYQYEFSM